MRLAASVLILSVSCLAASTTRAAEPAWRATVRDFAAKHFKHPAWGYSHSTRDYTLATELAKTDKVALDDDVLFAASYLHDMAAFAPWEKQDVDHADEAAKIIDAVLKDSGFPMTKIDAVRGAITTHMFDRTPVGPEALYLHDADALDWLGAIGAARIFGTVDPNGGQPDGPAAVKMLEDNLKQVPSRVLSPAGKARVNGMATELRQFIATLRRESNDLRDL